MLCHAIARLEMDAFYASVNFAKRLAKRLRRIQHQH